MAHSPSSTTTDEMAGDINVNVKAEPVSHSSSNNPVICDLMEDIEIPESVCDFLEEMDNIEERCYQYIGSVIGSNPLIRNFVNIYRGIDDFKLVSRHTGETWVTGKIGTRAFDLIFERPIEDGAPMNGSYKELRDVLELEVEYRLKSINFQSK